MNKPGTTIETPEREGDCSPATCVWVKAWVGKCDQPAVKNGCCEEHQKECCSCGKTATHDCEETGQFVCGAPLCDDCEHTFHEEGHNGGIGLNAQKPPEGMKSHCRKTEQRYQPWYALDTEANAQVERTQKASKGENE